MMAFLCALLLALGESGAERPYTEYTKHCAQFTIERECEAHRPPGVSDACHCQWSLYPGEKLPHYPECYFLPYSQGGSPACPDDPQGFLHAEEL
mmetsp:Transcript_5074/g.11265  ORF Transcript_5074/g.11265 Transcript_5074/m.11265 type:complete len:94 (-) Transcript_5074:56-337(-)